MNYKNAIEKLFHEISTDYANWLEKTEYDKENAYDEKYEQLWVLQGRKYDKIVVNQNGRDSVWGFIVKADGDKFKEGDILMAASWSSPATNHARGNIYEDYDINWTGPQYRF